MKTMMYGFHVRVNNISEDYIDNAYIQMLTFSLQINQK